MSKFHGDATVSKDELETQVAAAVAAAWQSHREANVVAAELALGQRAESEVFVTPPARGGIAKVRWLMAVLMGLILLTFSGLNFPGCREQLEKLNGLYTVNLSEAQVRAFFSLVNTNPNPLVKETFVDGGQGFTQKSFAWDPFFPLSCCLVLPQTNLFTPQGLAAMHTTIIGTQSLEAWNQNPQRVQQFLNNSARYRAVLEGWVSWQDLNILPGDCEAFLHTNRFPIYERKNWDRFFSRGESWSCVMSERFPVVRIQAWGVNELRFLHAVNSLDLVDREKLIQQIASVQTLSGTPPGQPPIHDWKDVRGLFFTPCWPALQDTYFSLAALEILGGLDRIDREQCIRGILRVHRGRGFFVSPDSGGFNEYHIDGSAQDTVAAFESLRILGALDRVKDLDKWQFRTSRRHLAKDEITWREIEAWVAQQRLEKILRARKANPAAPVRSLLEP